MSTYTNEFGQPLGFAVPDWTPPAHPPHTVLSGYGCDLQPLNAAWHADSLWDAFLADPEGKTWTYLTVGPFADKAAFVECVRSRETSRDPQYYAIVDATSGKALGMAAYLRIAPEAGSIEIGWLSFAPALQRSKLATAAMFLFMRNAFALGYRRYEWKCNSLNLPSKAAAERLGFTFEGTFRQATVNKGRNRDTDWYSMIDSEWPALQTEFERWLDDANFDAHGQQRSRLQTR